MKRSPGHWILLGLAGAAIVVFLVLGLLVTPAEEGYGTHEKLGLPPCTSMELLGVPCPGCGVTTSVSLASRGRLVESFRTQPLGLVVALLGVLSIPWALWGHFTGRDLYAEFLRLVNVPVIVVFALVVLGAWAYKFFVVLRG